MEKLSAQQVNFEAFRCELNMFVGNELQNYTKYLDNFKDLSDTQKNDVAISLYFDVKKDNKVRKQDAIQIWKSLEISEATVNLSAVCFLNDEEEKGYKYLLKAESMGSKIATLRKGYCILMGIAVKPDLKQACLTFKQLAQEKLPDAVYFTGATYMLDEDFVSSDKEKANKLLQWSLKNGCKFAEFEHGIALLMQKKTDEAVKLIRTAAGKQEVRAMMWLAIESARGTVIPRNIADAEKYLQNCCKIRFAPALQAVKEAKDENE